jgi:hypothetical protein
VPGPAPAVGAGDVGPEFGVLDGLPCPDGPADAPRGVADGDPEGRSFFDLGDFGRSARLDCDGDVMGAVAPTGEPGSVTTPSPAREITAHTKTAPTTTRTSQAEAARA